jgi:biotin transport system ATP-binding protein/energy-coupling factor transport system ATP-binding protein
MVFQNPDNQIVGMTVEEDIAFGPGNLGLPPAEVRRRVDQAMAMVGLQEMQTCSPYTLSGGQKQLLALAGLLAMEPKIIVLDEPVASLDPVSKEKVLSLLQDLKSRGISIIHITHSMDEIADSDRVLVMDQGQIAADAGAGEIFGRVEWLKSLGLAPPRLTELMWRLARQGEAVSANIFTVEKAFREISALLARERNSAQNQALRKAGGYV